MITSFNKRILQFLWLYYICLINYVANEYKNKTSVTGINIVFQKKKEMLYSQNVVNMFS